MVGSAKLPYVPPTPSPLEDEVEKAAKLQSQWPKAHICRAGLVRISREAWQKEPTYAVGEDRFAAWEMKNCPMCGSTLMVLTAIHDLGAE